MSRVRVILVARARPGLWGALVSRLLLLGTAAMLVVLRDDDVQAFPNMRFQPGRLVPADASVAKFIQWVNRLPISAWGRRRGEDEGEPKAE